MGTKQCHHHLSNRSLSGQVKSATGQRTVNTMMNEVPAEATIAWMIGKAYDA